MRKLFNARLILILVLLITVLPPASSVVADTEGPTPLYDSGWITSHPGADTVYHDLGAYPTSYIVLAAEDNDGAHPVASPSYYEDNGSLYGHRIHAMDTEIMTIEWGFDGIARSSAGDVWLQGGIASYRVIIFATDDSLDEDINTCGYDNYEPNNTILEPYGPLASNVTYYSYISECDAEDTAKRSDYYYFTTTSTGYIRIDLTSIPSGRDYDLYLYSTTGDDPGKWLAKSTQPGNGNELIFKTDQPAGTYYVRVYSYSGWHSSDTYALKVIHS